MAVIFLPKFVLVVYSSVLTIRSREYVEAARSLGAGSFHILFRTILPNIMGPVLVQFSLVAAAAITLESGLSF
ncbi:ABC transporter permease subunit, partial [Stenotrophomonas sp. GbtcB23]|uniref:ABC transporter permease subunit n=1 Tax=Stenotrophomonas sp. GbtcB23 TaxID=2824768 RepID=UPI001C2FB33B